MGVAVGEEVWAEVKRPNFDGRYEVSNYGNVRNLKTKRLLKPVKHKNGYLFACLCKNGKQAIVSVHRLVATAFIPNPNKYPIVNHKDETRNNNKASNLEWCTYKYNSNYGTVRERSRESLKKFRSSEKIKETARQNGSRTSKPVLQFDKQGNLLARYKSAKEAALSNKVNHSHVLDCCNKKRCKTVGGYIWKFEKEE